jgi:hypothetical protein
MKSINLRQTTVLLALFAIITMQANSVVFEFTAHVHTPGEPQLIMDAEPTCTKAGSCRYVVYCTTCGEIISSETCAIEPLGHDYTFKGDTYPTCTEAGKIQYTCSRCGADRFEVTSPALGHDYEVVGVVWATCTESGMKQLYCSRCGKSTIEEGEPPLGHNYTLLGETYPTCTEAGKIQYICSRCEDIRIDEISPPLGHMYSDPVKENIVEPTKTKDGSYDIVVYCLRCGMELRRETVTITTSVDAIKTDDRAKAVYSITGQRLVRPKKGVNITNGKKFVVK